MALLARVSVLLSIYVSISIVSGVFDCTKSNTWVDMPPLPKPTGETSSACIIGNNLLVAGEKNTATFKYSFNNSVWMEVAARIYPGNHQNSFVYKNEWWLIGGIDANSYGKVQIYNPENDSWRTEQSLPWDGGSVCVAFINDVIYSCGGIVGFDDGKNGGGTNTTNVCAKYEINGNKKWEMLGNMPYRRNHAATSAGPNGKMWIFGGREGKNVPSDGYPTIQVYDPVNNKWTTSNDTNSAYKVMPVGRGGTGHAVYNNGKFYIFGGETKTNPGGYATNDKVYNRTDIYDMNTNTWSEGTIMPHARHGIFPVLYENAIYIAGGGLHNGWNVSSDFDKYCL